MKETTILARVSGEALKPFESFNPWPKGQEKCHALRPGLSATG
jgi:hypothetical protein